MATRANLLRPRRSEEDGKVTFVELFFDLVFVFAVTQLSHRLAAHFSLDGLWQTGLLLMAVWWVWIYTSWVTNWIDPQRALVRVMLFVLMLAGLVLSVSIPHAFAETGLIFALAYAFMQVGRCLFMLWALKPHDAANYRNFLRITAWLALGAVFWVGGGIVAGDARTALWIVALLIEYASPAAGFWTPRLGRSRSIDWQITGAHMAERCGLFIIIALGESILVTGATFGTLPWQPASIAAFVNAFLGSVALWWVYFHIGAEHGSRHIAQSSDPGRTARLSYTYIHILLVAGIVVIAVADERILHHPLGHTGAGTAWAAVGGTALYLVGNLLFKWTIAGRVPVSHLVGMALLAGLAAVAQTMSPLLLGSALTATLVVVAIWEAASYRRRRPVTEAG